MNTIGTRSVIYLSKRSRQARALKADIKKAVEELNAVRAQLDDTYCRFNNLTDPAQLDTCIFEISALKSKYNCAVRNLKSFYL